MNKVTYRQTTSDASKLYFSIKIDKYRAIHPIPAGGISIATVFSILSGLPMLSVEEYKKYKNKKQVLVVDDLVDSGKTLERYKDSDTAVLYKKPHSPKPTYYLKDIESSWLIFPHEKDKDGILDHITRVFSFINIRLEENEEMALLNILNKIKKHEKSNTNN